MGLRAPSNGRIVPSSATDRDGAAFSHAAPARLKSTQSKPMRAVEGAGMRICIVLVDNKQPGCVQALSSASHGPLPALP